MAEQGPENRGGFVINHKTIPSIVGSIAIISAVTYFFERVNQYENRLSLVEYNDSLRTTEIKTLTQELKTLNIKLTELTIELREMRVIQQQQK